MKAEYLILGFIVFVACSATSSDRDGGAATTHQQQPQSDTLVTAVIPPQGGTVELSGVARAVFPSGAFKAAETVTIYTTNTPSTVHGQQSYDLGGGPLENYLPYDIRMSSAVAPSIAFEITLHLPETYLNELPPGSVPRVFIEGEGGGRQESLTIYTIVPSDFNLESQLIHVREFRVQPKASGSMFEILVVGR